LLAESVLARMLVFVDAGGGRLQDALPEQDDHFFLWSAGLGLRTALWRRLTAELDWAYPLEDSADGSIESGDSRWHFRTGYSF
jgi:hemolysin activation/secretion protein